MPKNNFSLWRRWTDRDEIEGVDQPGVYCIALLRDKDDDISGKEFDWIPEIVYIGMTNSKAGLKGRLGQFDDTIKMKRKVHGGADRF